jgi:LAS superfamily LD-carboxypeptidase LdcB
VNGSPINWKKVLLTSIAATLVILGILYGAYRYSQLRKQNDVLRQNVAELGKEVSSLELSLMINRAILASTTQALQAEQKKNGMFESQISQLSGTVSILHKLSATDPQLLKKYSKVYFLNENYAPASLSAIDSQYLFKKDKPEYVLSGIRPPLEALLASAGRDGVKLQIASAYRTFYEQASLKLGYKITYGAGTANQFSAEQGYSEHQLGTAVDFATPEVKDTFSKFATTAAYKWLLNNAHRFGFILSYPKDNIYYQFEPWHWRYIGVSLATILHTNNEYFYNLSQRDIDPYLISFFD